MPVPKTFSKFSGFWAIKKALWPNALDFFKQLCFLIILKSLMSKGLLDPKTGNCWIFVCFLNTLDNLYSLSNRSENRPSIGSWSSLRYHVNNLPYYSVVEKRQCDPEVYGHGFLMVPNSGKKSNYYLGDF